MISARSASHRFEMDLNLQRFDGEAEVQSIDITTEKNGTICIASRGVLSLGTLQQVLRRRKDFQRLIEATGQEVVVEHEGERLAHLQWRTLSGARWSINWWAVGLQFLFSWRRG